MWCVLPQLKINLTTASSCVGCCLHHSGNPELGVLKGPPCRGSVMKRDTSRCHWCYAMPSAPLHLQAQVLSSEAKRSPRGHAPPRETANVSTCHHSKTAGGDKNAEEV